MASNPEKPTCGICGEPMPEGEEMFVYHGFSGPCPKPPSVKLKNNADRDLLRKASRVKYLTENYSRICADLEMIAEEDWSDG